MTMLSEAPNPLTVKEVRYLVDLLNEDKTIVNVEDVIDILDALSDPSDNRYDWLVSKLHDPRP